MKYISAPFMINLILEFAKSYFTVKKYNNSQIQCNSSTQDGEDKQFQPSDILNLGEPQFS